MKTIFIDVMHNDRFVMTLPYKHNPLFKIDIEDVFEKIIENYFDEKSYISKI